MNTIKSSLNMLKPERAFVLKWLSVEQREQLIQAVLDMSHSDFRRLKYGWDVGNGKEE